jgi:hypothetical protein
MQKKEHLKKNRRCP